jgi:hypothetical protein
MGRFQNNPSIGWIHPKSTHALMLGAKIENLKSFWNKDTKTGHELCPIHIFQCLDFEKFVKKGRKT